MVKPFSIPETEELEDEHFVLQYYPVSDNFAIYPRHVYRGADGPLSLSPQALEDLVRLGERALLELNLKRKEEEAKNV